jgi:hypothetical protein
MKSTFLPVLLCIGTFVFLFVSYITASYASRRWIWLAIISAFLVGFLPGLYAYGFWIGVAIGIVLAIGLVPSVLMSRYYREKAHRWFKSNNEDKN